VPVVVFVTPLAPRQASCRVVAAPRRCVASRAGIRIIISRACQALCSELSVLPLVEVSLSGGTEDAKRWFSRPRFVGSRSAGSSCLVMHTWCQPVRVG